MKGKLFKRPFVFKDDGEFVTVKDSSGNLDGIIICWNNYPVCVKRARYIFNSLNLYRNRRARRKK